MTASTSGTPRGPRAPLPPLPWADVNARDGRDVTRALGLAPAMQGGRPIEGGRKLPCAWCASSDAMHAYIKGGVHCWSCGQNASNVDLATHVLRMTPAEALRVLAGRLGIYVPDAEAAPRVASATRSSAGSSVTSRDVPAAPAPRLAGPEAVTERNTQPSAPDPFAALRADGCVSSREAIYAGVLELLALTERGTAYLAGRGLDPAAAEADGFRALDGAGAWRALWAYLANSFTADELTAAGFPAGEDGRGVLPWGGQVPALLIPYRHRGAVVALRFRSLVPDAPHGTRYRNLPGAVPALPFNADALDAAAGGELHIVEGELNAHTLAAHGLNAVGLPGATPGAGWLAGWVREAARAAAVVAWYDADAAGAKGRGALAGALAAEFGAAWLARHGRRCTPPADANDLHRAGQLGGLLAAAPWRA